MRKKQPKISGIKLRPHYFSINSKVSFPQRARPLPFTFNHKSFLFISFMSNRAYSYIFSPVLSSGNISSQWLTGLYNLTKQELCKVFCMIMCRYGCYVTVQLLGLQGSGGGGVCPDRK